MTEDDRLADFAAWSALIYAEKGDWDELARHIEQGGKINKDVREFLCSVLRGKTKPKNRHALASTWRRHIDIVTFILLERRRGVTNATQMAAEKFNMDHRAVERVFKRYGKAAASFMADSEKRWSMVGNAPNEFAAYYARLFRH